jgi:hypothetical protein
MLQNGVSVLSPRIVPQRFGLCFALALFAVCRAGAAAPGFEFGWDVPEGCPSVDVIQEEFAHVVGRPWAALAERWQAVRAAVVPEGSSFRLRVRLRSHAGATSERELLANSCTEAAEAAVAILATSVAPDTDGIGGTPHAFGGRAALVRLRREIPMTDYPGSSH